MADDADCDARVLAERLEGMRLLHREQDRRYAEVNIEREKALKIKEEADKVALDLARQIQTYKDEKANELREQIAAERGDYVTKDEFSPLRTFIDTQTGKSSGTERIISIAFIVIGLILSLGGVIIALI